MKHDKRMLPSDFCYDRFGQARAFTMKTLCEMLAFAESFGVPVSWVNEDTLEMHWRCLTRQTRQRMKHTPHLPHAPLLSFGRPLVAISVAATTVHPRDSLRAQSTDMGTRRLPVHLFDL